MMLHLQSVRLAIPARVVMGTWGMSPFMLKMRSRGRVNAQVGQYHQSSYMSHRQSAAKDRGKKWQQDWIKKWPIIFTDSYSVLALGWGLEMVWVHEWALLQCQHNWISEVHESHRPHNKPGHGFISYWFKALLEMLPCSPVQFPLIFNIHNLRICNPVAKFQPALNRKYSESGNTPAINYIRSQTHVVHWQVDSSGDSSHLITHLKKHNKVTPIVFLCVVFVSLASWACLSVFILSVSPTEHTKQNPKAI